MEKNKIKRPDMLGNKNPMRNPIICKKSVDSRRGRKGYWNGKKNSKQSIFMKNNNPMKREDIKNKFRGDNNYQKKRPEIAKLKALKYRKGKTYEQIFGAKKAKELRKKIIKGGINACIAQGKNKISKAELKLKRELEQNRIEFVHQYPYPLGVADFYLPKNNLIIECYGSFWHSKIDYIKRDKRKNKWLKDNGYNILILCSEDINKAKWKFENIIKDVLEGQRDAC